MNIRLWAIAMVLLPSLAWSSDQGNAADRAPKFISCGVDGKCTNAARKPANILGVASTLGNEERTASLFTTCWRKARASTFGGMMDVVTHWKDSYERGHALTEIMAEDLVRENEKAMIGIGAAAGAYTLFEFCNENSQGRRMR